MGGKGINPTKTIAKNINVSNINIKRFWHIDNYEVLSKNNLNLLTKDKRRAMTILDTTKMFKEKHYEICLLWKTDQIE